MKIKTISLSALALLLTASLLCGCSSEQKSSGGSDSTVNSSGSESTVSEPEDSYDSSPSVPEDATFLKGALGDPIALSEITKAFNAEFEEVAPDQITEDNFGEAEAACGYFAYPSYPCRTSLDDSFDADNLIFTDIPQGEASGDYIKIKTGDKICGLTVSYATTSFNPMTPVTGSIAGTFIELEGEKTVTGYVWIVQEDEYGITAGDIKFIPTGDVRLPVVRFDTAGSDGIPKRSTGGVSMENGIYFTNDFGGSFDLGNISEITADISEIPNDGSYARVSITLSNIRMSSTLDWLTRANANIVSVKKA